MPNIVKHVLPRLRAAFELSVSDAERQVKIRTPVDTGRLRASVHGKTNRFWFWRKRWTGTVATNVEYAPYVEYGTSRMRPRAMFRRGVDAALPPMMDRLHKAFQEGIVEYMISIGL